MKKIISLVAIIGLLILAYLLGPKIPKYSLDKSPVDLPLELKELEGFINEKETHVKNLRMDNHARIVWAHDSLKTRTPYSIVYLHGFSASQGEGIPLHINFASRYGCNLYLPRLYGHGIQEENALEDMTPDKLAASAKEAIAIGKKIGEKVILMGTSTGGTLALYLGGGDPDIAGIYLYSPNIKINNPFVFLLAGPWGLQIGRQVAGGKNLVYPVKNYGDSLYWTKSYRVEGVANLQLLLDATMKNDVFQAVTQPVFLGYYYKNEEEQDETVRVDAMLEMFGRLGTPEDRKWKRAFPDAGEHVITCEYKSNDWKGVQEESYRFAEEILGLKPVH